MISQQFYGRSAAALVVLTMTLPAMAQNAADEAQNKLLAKRAAEADCYRKLAETVYGVKLGSDTYVRDFVTESDEIRTAVDHFVKGIRLGTARYYDDGICEVDAEVTVAKLVKEIKTWHEHHYHGRHVTIEDIEHIHEYLKTDVIRVTGSGAPRPDLPPDLPAGVEDLITPLPSGYAPAPSIPSIWKSVGPQGRLMAQRAARVEAMRRLLEEIKGLRLTSDTLVRDFITESDEISARADGLVYGAAEVSTYLHDDELIAEVTMEVAVEKVVQKIEEMHREHYHGRHVHTTDITNITNTVKRKMIRATGSGVPPSRFLVLARSAGVSMPDWVAEHVSATGEGTDPQIETAQGKLRAARAAELDAMRKLAEQVYGLSVQSETTVRDFVAQFDDIATRVEAVLAGAVAQPATFGDGTATVTVSIAASDVWSVVHHQMQMTRRRG